MSHWRSIALAVLLVVSAVAPGGPVGTAAAAEQHCSEVDDFLFTVTNGLVNADQCKPSELADEMEQIKEDEDEKTHSDLTQSLSAQRETFESLLAQRENYVQDSRTHAYLSAENETAHALQTGDPTLTELNNTAEDAAVDYYTETHQYADVNAWNKQVLGLKYAYERAENESGLNATDIVSRNVTAINRENAVANRQDRSLKSLDFGTKDITLANGTTREVQTVIMTVNFDPNWDGGKNDTVEFGPRSGTHKFAVTFDGYESSSNVSGIVAEPPPESSVDNFSYLNFDRMENRFEETGDASELVADNARKNAKSMYEAEQDGQFDPSNYSNPYAMAQEYATDYNTTGHWSYALASGASMGYSVPDLNGTSVMFVTYGSEQYEGQIMSANGPPSTNGDWVAGETYNPDNIEGTQWLMRTDGNLTKLTGEFTVERMTDQNGDNVTQTETVKYVYKTDNSSDMERRQELMMDLVREINAREPAAGGGGDGSGMDFDFSRELLIAAVAVAGAVLLTRE